MRTHQIQHPDTSSNGSGPAAHHTDIPVHIDADHVHQTLRRHMLADGYGIVLDLANSGGGYLVDARNGKRYLDFFTFFASNPIGLNNPGMNTPEFVEKLGHVALQKPSSSDMYTVEMAEFVETFFRVAVPARYKYGFFIEGGALAVENGLKAAFDWKVRRNFARRATVEKGHKVLHFEHAFHGRSGYTLSLTNTDPAKTKYFPKFDWPRVPAPAAIYPLEGENLEATVRAEHRAVAAIERAFAENPDEIACIIIEPIQGEGGDNHFRPQFLRELRRLADEHEALLIFDEVQTGIGLTGHMWAAETLGVWPDIICFGKKMQVCGILATDRIDSVEENVFHTSSRINSTWGGNLVDMVRATRFLEIIDEESLVENAHVVGEHLLERVVELCSEFPDLLSNPRGRGLMCAFDVATHALRARLRERMFEHGVLILGCGERSIRFRPPLDVTRKQIDEGLGLLRQAAAEVAPAVGIEATESTDSSTEETPPSET